MSLVSRMEAAEDGLLAALLAHATLAGVPPQLGDPGPTPPGENVWIEGNATADWDPDVTMGSSPTMDEIYELHVRILVIIGGDDYEATRDRAGVLGAGVTDAVAGNRRLGGVVDDSYVTRVERDIGATDAWRGVDLRITVRARSSLA